MIDRAIVSFREDLDTGTCNLPGCTHEDHKGGALSMHGQCHPEAPSVVAYQSGTGILEIYCSECRGLIVLVAVASVFERLKSERHA